MKRAQKKHQSRTRKWIKALFITLTVLFALLFLFFVILWLFPARNAGTIASGFLTRALDQNVSIERLSFRPSGLIEMAGFRIKLHDGSNDTTVFTLKRLGIQIRLYSLMFRKIDIKGIMIDSPSLSVIGPSEIRPDKTPTSKKKPREKKEPQSISLPLSLGLFRLKLDDFQFFFGSVPGKPDFQMRGLCLEIDDLRIPRTVVKDAGEARGKVHLFTREGRLEYGNETWEAPVLLDLNVDWKPDMRWNLSSLLMIGEPSIATARLSVDGEGTGFDEGRASIHLDMGNQRLLSAEGRFSGSFPEAKWNAGIDGDDLNLNRLLSDAVALLPAAWTSALASVNLHGRGKLLHADLSGESGNILIRAETRLRGIRSLGPSDLALDGAGVTIQFEGSMGKDRFEGGSGRVRIHVDSTKIPVNGSYLPVSGLDLVVDSQLDSKFSPVKGSILHRIEKILGGRMGFNGQWRIPANRTWESLDSKWDLSADSLELEKLPLAVSMSGNCSVRLFLGSASLKRTSVALLFSTPGFVLSEQESLPTLDLRMRTLADLRPSEGFYRVDSLSLGLNDAFHALLSGQFHAKQKKIQARIVRAEFDNSRILSVLPTVVKKSLEGQIFSGREEIRAELSGDAHDLNLHAAIGLNAGWEMPSDSIRVEGIRGEISCSGSMNHLTGKADIEFGSVEWNLRSEPLKSARMSLQCEFHPGERLDVTLARVEIPSIHFASSIDGRVELKKVPSMAIHASGSFESKSSVEIIQGIDLMGRLNLSVDGKTLDAEKQWLQLQAELETDSLDLNLGENVQIRAMQGRLPVNLRADGKNKQILAQPGFRPRNWNDYEKNRTVYRSAFSDLGNLKIGMVQVSGYRMEGVDIDMAIQGGMVQIPWFLVRVFDGNVGGSLLVDVGGKPLEEAVYQIRAQVSRINSAVLAGKGSGEEETEVNATLAFQGRGLDVKEGIELDGFFHLTQIGPRFASTLLQAMDPGGSDRSIQLTRRLLNTGWKPRLFSFELSHGYVYPSLSLTQPWFSPIRIPGNLEYGRLPLAFFLQSLSK